MPAWARRRWNVLSRWTTWAAPGRPSPCRAPGSLPQSWPALAREVGRICRRTLEPPQVLSCKGMTTLLFSERPALRAVFGAAGAAARGEVSGDAVQQFCSPAAAQMILCDGMGTGRPAAVDGNLAGRADRPAAQGGLYRRTGGTAGERGAGAESEDESGATLDLISVDFYTGTARLFKAGAAPGFLVHGGRVRAVGEATLPMGVLGGVNGQSRVVHLTAGDYAVLVSDGLTGGRRRLGGEAGGALRGRQETRPKSWPRCWWRPPASAREQTGRPGRYHRRRAPAGKS
ncbi:MAG: SpoIIE family protein phosphatase [Faecalibacterium prausnitzii]